MVVVRGGGGGQGCLGGVSRCHSIDRLPKLWLLHLFGCKKHAFATGVPLPTLCSRNFHWDSFRPDSALPRRLLAHSPSQAPSDSAEWQTAGVDHLHLSDARGLRDPDHLSEIR